MPMTAKLVRMAINFEGLVPIMLLEPFVTWSCDVRW